jgi:hypothetical protein
LYDNMGGWNADVVRVERRGCNIDTFKGLIGTAVASRPSSWRLLPILDTLPCHLLPPFNFCSTALALPIARVLLPGADISPSLSPFALLSQVPRFGG